MYFNKILFSYVLDVLDVLDVLSLTSDNSLDNLESNTELTQGATEHDIYLANRPKRTEVDWIFADIQDEEPNFYEWLHQNPNQIGKEVCYSFLNDKVN